MAYAQKILGSDTLRIAYPKINQAIDNANDALTKSTTAETEAADAKSISESVQEQLSTLVVDSGTSDAETLQARTRNVDGQTITFDVLKDRLDNTDSQIFSTATSLNSRGVSVLDFGAKLDGVTDDGTTIQSAIDSLGDAGGTVIFPQGYTSTLVGTTIKVPSNVALNGNGITVLSKLVFPSSGGSHPTCVFENSDPVNGNSNIKITGFEINGQANAGTWIQGATVEQDNLIRMIKVTGLEMDVHIFNYRNNKSTVSPSPTTFYGAHFEDCEDVTLNNFKLTGVVNTEGIHFLRSNNVYLNKFYSENTQCWTPLHLWYCDGVTVENSTILEDVGAVWDASTVNVYSKNVTFRDCTIEGGQGIDPSDELQQGNGFISENVTFNNCQVYATTPFYSSHASLVKKFKIIDCDIKSKAESINFYALSFDGVIIKDNFLATEDGTKSGIRMDTRLGAYLHDLTIDNNTCIGHNTGIYIYLRDGVGVKNLKVNKNNIKVSPLGSKDSGNGSSGGIVFYLYDLEARPNCYFKNVTVDDNDIDAEGSYILVLKNTPSSTAIKAENFIATKNTCISSGAAASRGIQIAGIKNPLVDGNTFKDLSGQNIFNTCSDIRVTINVTEIRSGLDVSAGYRLESCSGIFQANGNSITGTPSNRNHFYSNGTNNFTAKAIVNNLPNTSDSNI